MGKLQFVKSIPLLGDFVYTKYMKVQEVKRHYDNVKRVKAFEIPKGKKIFYLDIPIHSNLGDIAQYLCTQKWLKDNYPDYTVVEIDGYILSDLKCGMLDKLAKSISCDDMIFFQSGYCTQDLGGYHDLVHKEVIKACPNTPIIMLPQTVFYQDEKHAIEATSIYEKHGKIFFLARDFVSEKMAKELFPHLYVEAFPDIVTSLIGSVPPVNNKQGVIFCIRNDSEKFYSDDEINRLIKRISRVAKTRIFDTTISTQFSDIKGNLDRIVMEKIEEFQTAKVVITDRYHGTIFSLVAGTPVIVIQSTDHKVKTGVEWFDGVYDNIVYFANDLLEAENLVQKILLDNTSIEMSSYFKEKFYSLLKNKISDWLQTL